MTTCSAANIGCIECETTLRIQLSMSFSKIPPVIWGCPWNFWNLSGMVGNCRILRLGMVLRYSEILEKIVGTCRILSRIVGLAMCPWGASLQARVRAGAGCLAVVLVMVLLVVMVL
jgi:hypothetical protein